MESMWEQRHSATREDQKHLRSIRVVQAMHLQQLDLGFQDASPESLRYATRISSSFLGCGTIRGSRPGFVEGIRGRNEHALRPQC